MRLNFQTIKPIPLFITAWVLSVPLFGFIYDKGSDTKQKNNLLVKGDSITTHTQQLLMKNVMLAIQQKGVPGAVDFCSEKAVILTDSASSIYSSRIQRITDKNRNPDNTLKTAIDKKAWEEISKMMTDKNIVKKQLIIDDNNSVYYYKAIPLGMPTCLSCHGNTQKDITPETLAAIKIKYPNDKATGYSMGQLRGLWKVRVK